ncbi:hypothetical protein M8745_20710, partial [Lutimaribacter sp. EGI FJ00014]|nr:hypothetical protein [Lutimaribacter sp. EGI FJ00014]
QAGTSEEEGEALDMLPVTKNVPEQEDGESKTAPTTDEAEDNKVAASVDPVKAEAAVPERKDASSDKPATTLPSSASADAPDTNDTAIPRDSALPANVPTADKGNTRQTPQESSPPKAEQPAPPRATDGGEPSTKAATRAASALAAQDGAMQDRPSGGGRQDAENGKPPVRV